MECCEIYKENPYVQDPCQGEFSLDNSFHLLARADGRDGVGNTCPKSHSLQEAIEFPLSEKNIKNKGKGKLGEEKEILMRGFSPTA
jgi:hypothetical protein